MTTLSVWLESAETPIGVLHSGDYGELSFAYTPEWLATAHSHPLSLSMPLRTEPFGDLLTRDYFDNLLQENGQLKQLLRAHRLQRSDIAEILEHLGADCPGGLSCLPIGAPPVKRPGNLWTDYDPLSEADMDNLVQSLANGDPLPEGLRDPSPVAGVRQKTALAALPDGRFAIPKAGTGVPTTHILKIPDPDHPAEAIQEFWSAQLALACGLLTGNCAAGNRAGQDYLLIKRFDRDVTADGNVSRIHQEDFAQAAGLPAGLKYQRKGLPDHRFDAAVIGRILEQTENPLESRLTFLRITLFNLLIGNSDNHAKNHALLHIPSSAPILAPFYDLVPTRMEPDFTDQFAFDLGAAQYPDEVTADDLFAFCAAIGVAEAGVRELLPAIAREMVSRLEAASTALPRDLRRFDMLIGQGLHRINDLLGLDVELRERDAFIVRAEAGNLANSPYR